MRRTQFIAIALLFIACASQGRAHSWYPRECCSENDCAPVESFEPRTGPRGQRYWSITSKVGKALVKQDFPLRRSLDSRWHVCIRFDEFGRSDVVCLFAPPNM